MQVLAKIEIRAISEGHNDKWSGLAPVFTGTVHFVFFLKSSPANHGVVIVQERDHRWT